MDNVTPKEEFFGQYELRVVTKEFDNPVFDGRHRRDFYSKKTIGVDFKFRVHRKLNTPETLKGYHIDREVHETLMQNSEPFEPSNFDEFSRSTLAGVDYSTDVLDILWNENPALRNAITEALYKAYIEVEMRENS